MIGDHLMENIGQLTYRVNAFKSVVVSPDSLPESAATFGPALQVALNHWRERALTMVWLEIPSEEASLIPAATALGFTFHHCEPAYLMLTYRLKEDAFIPPYATHYAGVGGVVLNRHRELLVVVEKADRERRPNYYKLPGGALHAGEHIVSAAIREVLEETGVETEFKRLVCIRHWHNYRYGKSDLYFVCRLAPLTEAITRQTSEIYKCLWMPVQEYLDNENVGVFNKRIVECAMLGKGLASGWFEGYDKDPSTREILLPIDHTRD